MNLFISLCTPPKLMLEIIIHFQTGYWLRYATRSSFRAITGHNFLCTALRLTTYIHICYMLRFASEQNLR